MISFRNRSLIWILAFFLMQSASAETAAEGQYRLGSKAQHQGNDLDAYLLFNRARALDPMNMKYLRAAQAVRRKAAQLLASSGQHQLALKMATSGWEFQSLSDAFQNRDQTEPTVNVTHPRPRYKEPVVLQYDKQPRSFRLRGKLREVYESVAEEFGIRVIFDESFNDIESIKVDLEDCGFPCVMRVLGEVGGTVALPYGPDLILVVPDTQAKRQELEPVAVASIALNSSLPPEQITEISQAIKGTLDITRFQPSVSGGMLLMRDSASKIRMAQALAESLMHPLPAVQIEVMLLSVSRGQLSSSGIDLPNQFPVTNLSTFLGAMPAGVDASNALIGLGGGETVLGVSVGDATVLASLDASESQFLQHLQIRSNHGMETELNIGERYPIATAQYTGGSLGTGSTDPSGAGSYIQPFPTISFEDLGLNLIVTPRIHSSRSVTFNVDVNFRFLAGGMVNNIPILANRSFKSQMRLDRGEFAVVSGMAIYENRHNRSRLAGLGSIPLLKYLFRKYDRRWQRSDLLILMRPTIVQLPASETANLPAFLFGSEESALPIL